MAEDPRFLREAIVDVDAAVVGIGSAAWVHLTNEEASVEAARRLMQKHRFDILPIVSPAGVREYFRTHRWNDYSEIHRSQVSHRDLLPLLTPVREVIRGFAQEHRTFYFLAQDRRIKGLVSIPNLNCRQVTVWLFSLVAELEAELAEFVARRVGENTLLIEDFPAGQSGRVSEIRQRYDGDRAKGVDAPLVEYLYLSDLVNVVSRRKLFRPLGYGSRGKFESLCAPILELRNAAAHPVRSIVTTEHGCVQLWATLQNIEEVLFALRTA